MFPKNEFVRHDALMDASMQAMHRRRHAASREQHHRDCTTKDLASLGRIPKDNFTHEV